MQDVGMAILSSDDDATVNGGCGNVFGDIYRSHPDVFTVIVIAFPASAVVDDVMTEAVQFPFAADEVVMKTRLPAEFGMPIWGTPARYR